MFRTHLINRERVRCQRFGAAAKREEEEHPATSTELEHALRSQAFAKAYFVDQVMSSFEVAGSSTDEQRSRSGKDRQPSGLSSGPSVAGRLCSFVARCQTPARLSAPISYGSQASSLSGTGKMPVRRDKPEACLPLAPSLRRSKGFHRFSRHRPVCPSVAFHNKKTALLGTP